MSFSAEIAYFTQESTCSLPVSLDYGVEFGSNVG